MDSRRHRCIPRRPPRSRRAASLRRAAHRVRPGGGRTGRTPRDETGACAPEARRLAGACRRSSARHDPLRKLGESNPATRNGTAMVRFLLLVHLAELAESAPEYDRLGGRPMLGIVAILVILWLLGVLTKNTLGGALHILLVVAIVFGLISVIRGRGL